MPIKSLLVFLYIFLSAVAAANPPPISAADVCRTTVDPAYCMAVLQAYSHTADVYEYGHFCLRRSLSQADKFLSLTDGYLRSGGRRLTPSAVGALQDCRELAELSVDYLRTALRTATAANRTLPIGKADDVVALMSAVITNQHTCADGLHQAGWSVEDALGLPCSDDAKLHGVSLALVIQGWVPDNIKRPFGLQRRGSGSEAASRRTLDGDMRDVKVRGMVTVSQDGTGNFTTIMEAVAVAPNNTDGSCGYFVIYVRAGVYDECVTIHKKTTFVMMVGDGINQTIITSNRSVVDGWTTFRSATLAVSGRGFIGVNMTVRNTAGAIKHQAVALRSNADQSTFYKCSFEGYQDTFYAHSLRQFYRDCDIYGTVDFIFGNGAAVLQNCNIYPRLPMEKQFNTITAQGCTDPNQDTGISLQNCTIRPSSDLAAANGTTQTYLGRPWKQFSRTVYMQSNIDGFINPVGWKDWNGTEFALDTCYYGEFNNTGPGSDLTNRVNWRGYHVMNLTSAANFTVSSFLLSDDWLQPTGVPYYTGLLNVSWIWSSDVSQVEAFH